MRVFLAVSQKIFLIGLVQIIEHYKDIHVIGTAIEKSEMEYRLADLSTDILLVDETIYTEQRLGKSSIFEDTRGSFSIVLLLYSLDPIFITECVQKGIKGFIHSTEDPESLPTAFRAVLTGDQWMSYSVFATFFTYIKIPLKPTVLNVTEREKQLIGYLLKDLTNRDIASEMRIAERTVEYHIQKLLKKFGVRSRGGLIVWANNNMSSPDMRINLHN